MPTNVKIKLNIKPELEKRKKAIARGLCDVYTQEVLGDISKGVSPVKGKKFQIYSDSYKEAIRSGQYSEFGKSIAPINLYLSGSMIDSWFCKTNPKGISMGFKDKVAEYHNSMGASKSKVIRRLLPTNSGESFNSSIEIAVQRYLDNLSRV